ncbi:MAG: 50S ribosomal protein L4 [Candidatus Woesearchaeota archaeon]
MKIKVKDLENREIRAIELPFQFSETVRSELIKKAFLAIVASKRQPYGSFEDAGKRPSAKLMRRRRVFRTSYGYGISRVPRKILARRGSRFIWVGAFAPGTVSGRRAHPPKSEKLLTKKLNKKENKKAIRSALSASMNKDLVLKKYSIPEDYPFAVSSEIEKIKKTSEVKRVLERIGFKEELEKMKNRKIRAGKGKTRGRKYKRKRGLLIVVNDEKCELKKSAKNLGIEVVPVKKLNVEVLAPGANPGRLVLFTEDAIKSMEKEKLFA